MGSWSRREGKASTFPTDTASFFKIVLDKALRHGILEIPEAVVMKYGDRVADTVFLEVPDGEVWSIGLTRHHGRIWLGKGWPEFAQFYALEHGYMLLFSSEEDYCHYRVRIFMRNTLEIAYSPDEETSLCEGEDDFPAKRDAGGSCSSQTPLKGTADVLGRMATLTESEKALALERTSAFKSEDPYFRVVLQPAYIHRGYLLVPSEFAKEHLMKLSSACDIILKISDGRTWSVKLKYDSTARLQLGWRAFVRDNNLKVGDVCVFELVNDNKRLFEVVCFRDPEAENCALSPGKYKRPSYGV